jgi:hypothetical protein
VSVAFRCIGRIYETLLRADSRAYAGQGQGRVRGELAAVESVVRVGGGALRIRGTPPRRGDRRTGFLEPRLR